jgi:hypothetical protein
MNTHAVSGFGVKMDTVENGLVFSGKTCFLLSVHVVCHANIREVLLPDKFCMCSAMRVTRIPVFLGGGGGGRPQFTSLDAILWAPLLLHEKFFLFPVRPCIKL